MQQSAETVKRILLLSYLSKTRLLITKPQLFLSDS